MATSYVESRDHANAYPNNQFTGDYCSHCLLCADTFNVSAGSFSSTGNPTVNCEIVQLQIYVSSRARTIHSINLLSNPSNSIASDNIDNVIDNLCFAEQIVLD